MYAASTITWLLVLFAVWMVCLVIIIPLSIVLSIMIKDLLNNDGMKIRGFLGSIHEELGKMVKSQSQGAEDKLPIKRTATVTKEQYAEEDSGHLEGSNREVEEVPRKRVSLKKEQHSKVKVMMEPSGGIIYLDRQTSLTTDFPEDDANQ